MKKGYHREGGGHRLLRKIYTPGHTLVSLDHGLVVSVVWCHGEFSFLTFTPRGFSRGVFRKLVGEGGVGGDWQDHFVRIV